MRLKTFPTFLSIIVSVILGYLGYTIAEGDSDAGAWAAGIGTGVCVLLTVLPLIAMRLEVDKQSVNMKAWSFAAFAVMLALNLCFAIFGVAEPYYALTVGLLLCIHLYVVWKLAEIKDV